MNTRLALKSKEKRKAAQAVSGCAFGQGWATGDYDSDLIPNRFDRGDQKQWNFDKCCSKIWRRNTDEGDATLKARPTSMCIWITKPENFRTQFWNRFKINFVDMSVSGPTCVHSELQILLKNNQSLVIDLLICTFCMKISSGKGRTSRDLRKKKQWEWILTMIKTCAWNHKRLNTLGSTQCELCRFLISARSKGSQKGGVRPILTGTKLSLLSAPQILGENAGDCVSPFSDKGPSTLK